MEDVETLSLNQKLNISAGFAFIIFFSSIFTGKFSVFCLQIFMGLITLFFCFKTDFKTAKLWLTIFGVSMIYVFLIFLAYQLYYGEPYYIGGSDDLKFEQWGKAVYSSGIYNPSKIMEHRIIGRFHNSPYFASYIARLIQFSKLFGEYTTYLPRIANTYYLLWTCMIIKYLLKKYTDLNSKTVYYSILAFAFMPNIQYINAHVFRDTFNLLQILLIVVLIDLLLNKARFHIKLFSIILLPLLLYYTYYTRANSILFAGVMIMLILSRRYKIKTRYIIIGIIPILTLSNLLELFRVQYYMETYSGFISNIAGDGFSGVVFKQPLLPLGILFRGIYALLSPFPNFLGLFKDTSKILFDLVQLLIYLGVLLQILAIPFIVKRTLKLDWLAITFLSWFVAIIASTFTFRHFMLYYPFMSAVAVDGFLSMSLNRRRIILFLSMVTTINFGLIYILLKMFT